MNRTISFKEAELMDKASTIFAHVKKEGRKSLLETEAKTVCADYGIPVTKFKLAKRGRKRVV